MFKKIIALSLTVAMMTAASVTAFAAGTIDDNEAAILAELEAKNVPAEYISQAQNYFEQDDVEVTADEAEAIIANIDDAAVIAKEAGIKSAEDLKKVDTAVIDKIMVKVSAAAETIGLTAAFDAKTGKAVIKDKAGKVVATTNVGTKPMGADSMSTVVVVSVLGAAVVAMVAAAKKSSKVEA